MGSHSLLPGGGGFRAVPEGRPSCWLGGERKQRAVRGGSTWVEAERRPQAQRAWWSRLTASQDDLASVSPNC